MKHPPNPPQEPMMPSEHLQEAEAVQHQAPEAATTEKCHLLEMPAEIRNQIYRDALVESDGIVIATKDFTGRQPALLKTCRTIRSEATKIYYAENEFVIAVGGFEAGSLMHIPPGVDTRGLMTPERIRCFNIGATSHWDSIVAWIKVANQNGAPRPVVVCPESGELHKLSYGMYFIQEATWWKSKEDKKQAWEKFVEAQRHMPYCD